MVPNPEFGPRLRRAVATNTDRPPEVGGGGRRETALLFHVRPKTRGRPYRVRGDVRARLLGELEASVDPTASDPTPTSDTMDYHSSAPFSSYRVPRQRHK